MLIVGARTIVLGQAATVEANEPSESATDTGEAGSNGLKIVKVRVAARRGGIAGDEITFYLEGSLHFEKTKEVENIVGDLLVSSPLAPEPDGSYYAKTYRIALTQRRLDEVVELRAAPKVIGIEAAYLDPPDFTVPEGTRFQLHVLTDTPILAPCDAHLTFPHRPPVTHRVSGTPNGPARTTLAERLKAQGADLSIDPDKQMVDIVYKPPVGGQMDVRWATAVPKLNAHADGLRQELEALSDGLLTFASVFESYVKRAAPMVYKERAFTAELHIQLNPDEAPADGEGSEQTPSGGNPSRDALAISHEWRRARFPGSSLVGGNWRADCHILTLGLVADQGLDTVNGTVGLRWTRFPSFAPGLDLSLGGEVALNIEGDQKAVQPRATAELRWTPDIGSGMGLSVGGRGWFNPQGDDDLEGHIETEFSIPWGEDSRLFVKYIAGAEPPEFGTVNEWSWGIAASR